jgi:hypothetical protein
MNSVRICVIVVCRKFTCICLSEIRIQDEMHRCGKYGLGLALDMIPISLCDSAQAPDLYVSCDGAKPQEADINNTLPVSASSELCQRRMAELVQELVDSGDL